MSKRPLALTGNLIAGMVSTLWLAMATIPAVSQIQVVAPEKGAVVNAGGTLTVTIKAPPGMFQSVSVVGEGPFALSTTLNAPPYQCSYTIPADSALGRYQLKAAGLKPSGETVYSESIEIYIERPDEVKTLKSEWLSVTLGDLKDQTLLIWGIFGDGSKVDVTRSKRTTYSSDKPSVVQVSSDGTLSAAGVGKAKITVRYGDKVLVIPVTNSHNAGREDLGGQGLLPVSPAGRTGNKTPGNKQVS